MIVVDENEYAQLRIKNKDIGDNIYHTLSILARYYYSQGIKHKGVCIELQNFLEIAYPKYIQLFACKYKKHLAIMQPLYDYFQSFIFKQSSFKTCIHSSLHSQDKQLEATREQ